MSEFVVITLAAEGMGALSTASLTALKADLAKADGAPVLLTGGGRAFSAGLNLKEVLSLDSNGMRDFLVLLEEVVDAVLNHPGPTVAAINGHAIAGGAVIARCCDVAIATSSSKARIGLTETAIGLEFPPRTLQALQFRIPQRHHHEVLLGAGLHSPPDALRLGLVDALAEDVRAAAEARLAVLARHPSDAYAATKASLQAGVTAVDAAAADRFLQVTVPLWTSEPIRDRIRAVLSR